MAGPVVITVELLLNSTWTDISKYVYQRNPVTLTGGRPDEASKAQPAQLSLTLNNRDGRFTPNNTAGAYSPWITRNTNIRLTVTYGAYSGYRFWGEVPSWPPLSDTTGTDIYVDIVATGPLRRLRQGGGKGSALTRYYATLASPFTPVAYWPCEEDPDASIVGAGIDGGTDMTVTAGTPTWKAGYGFNGSAPIGILDNSTWDGLTGSFASSGDDIYNAAGTYTWVATTSTVNVKCWGSSGGSGSSSGGGGGGGEFAQNTAVAVTAGNPYTFTVPSGGRAGTTGSNSSGGDGAQMQFAGDSQTVTAHGGKGGVAAGNAGGAGGTGSGAPVHFDGGAGGTGFLGSPGGGGGGGGSGGTAATGHSGANATNGGHGAGGSAVTGGGKGGDGGDGNLGNSGAQGTAPAGGAGGGGFGNGNAGLPGKIEFVYTPQSVPTNNVIRFVLIVPHYGGNNGKVLLRALTGGTIARLDCLYLTGGNLQLKGYDNVNTLLFTSTQLAAGADGQPLMVSMELAPSGANMAYKLRAIIPGNAAVVGTVSGTQSTASIGNVTEVIAAPNADITKTAMGHISVQYALIDLTKVSNALNGHVTEMGVDRFIRLCNEQAMDNAVEFLETSDHWGFETGTQSWGATNGAVTQSAVTHTTSGVQDWPSEGSNSLLLTANGSGQPFANSPSGVNGLPINALDIASVAVDVFAPVSLPNAYAGVKFFTAAGAALTETDSADVVLAANTPATFKVTATAPATAAFFNIHVGDHNTDANGTLLYIDNVRVHPRMGAQTRKEYHKFLEEIEDLDQGIMKEARTIHGLKYRTRIRMINQAPAVTLDYSLAQLAVDVPAPVIDDQKVKNQITVHRHKGSKVTVGGGGAGPPGTGGGGSGGVPYRKLLKVAAEKDEQLLALAQHLLNLGTVTDERYPLIGVDLVRPEVASIMTALAGLEIGDRLQCVNLPSWYPSATADQLILGYSEVITPFDWTIEFNCTPASPYTILSTLLRRW